jgi:hypothetical protein
MDIIYSDIQSKPPAGGYTIWGIRSCPQIGCESGDYGDLGQFYQGASCTNPGQGITIPCSGATVTNSCQHWVLEGNTCEQGYRNSERPLGFLTQQYADSAYCNQNGFYTDFIVSALGYDTWDNVYSIIKLPCVPI